MAALPLLRRVFGQCHKWPIARRIVALYHIRRVARELNVPVTLRRVSGGVIFWRSGEEDLRQAQATSAEGNPLSKRDDGFIKKPAARVSASSSRTSHIPTLSAC